jgi:hypothetical protein
VSSAGSIIVMPFAVAMVVAMGAVILAHLAEQRAGSSAEQAAGDRSSRAAEQ